MKKIEFVFEEMLYQAIERKERTLTQSFLSRELSLSLSTVNLALGHLRKMGAVDVKTRSFTVTDPKKVLLHWASVRNPSKDIIYATRAEMPVRTIESSVPHGTVFGAYTAYKMRFGDVPADYSEVYLYGDESVKERFLPSSREPNVFVLRKDGNLGRYGETTTVARTFADLWNIGTWYAKDFLNALEARIDGILE